MAGLLTITAVILTVAAALVIHIERQRRRDHRELIELRARLDDLIAAEQIIRRAVGEHHTPSDQAPTAAAADSASSTAAWP